MIKTFRHKGLKEFRASGNTKGILHEHAPKLGRILDVLEEAGNPLDLCLPGYGLHELKGQRKGTWAVKVSGNWRVTFAFDQGNAIDVDYEDYHGK